MHLTNYSVNKHSEMYVDNEVCGTKRWDIKVYIIIYIFYKLLYGFSRITTLNNWLSSKGFDVKKIWTEIDDVIIKTTILAYPFVKRSYQTCFSGHNYMSACFDILGFDIILDENCKPNLLEVGYLFIYSINFTCNIIKGKLLLYDTVVLY